MSQPATILPTKPQGKLSVVLTAEEENLVALIANIIVDKTMQQAYEEGNQVSALQQ